MSVVYSGGDVMRYTEEEVSTEINNPIDLVRYVFLSVFLAPLRLMGEISSKVMFMGREHLEKILSGSLLTAVALLLFDGVYFLITGKIDLFSGFIPVVSKVIVIVGIGAVATFGLKKIEQPEVVMPKPVVPELPKEELTEEELPKAVVELPEEIVEELPKEVVEGLGVVAPVKESVPYEVLDIDSLDLGEDFSDLVKDFVETDKEPFMAEEPSFVADVKEPSFVSDEPAFVADVKEPSFVAPPAKKKIDVVSLAPKAPVIAEEDLVLDNISFNEDDLILDVGYEEEDFVVETAPKRSVNDDVLSRMLGRADSSLMINKRKEEDV